MNGASEVLNDKLLDQAFFEEREKERELAFLIRL